ncbi:L-arabinose isomerase [Pullulanibacillus camelliae]|uniref:L-arabinose isomerase n=1 Tax=Pullulanibacillus camelliae TaxID=1707096 RepID=A0A8J2YB03_9BACL|nr:L-arabinose isomerase [Pullulanibacillus camelliae]GGE25758.1 L-arabinose isomerase [Pullulanibacillus camelliae]
MISIKPYEFWFVTGSQHLYGEDALREVEKHSIHITQGLNQGDRLPYKLVFKSVLTTSDAIRALCREANSDENCAGLMTWMHTFSPAKMWIAGLSELQKPILHLHTQFNRDIPWDDIDMDFMNLNQSAHGDREYGFIHTRMQLSRKVIVGYWQDEAVKSRLSAWMQTAVGHNEGKGLKVARFGDNMRHVAVTEGDKVEAQIKLGWTVDYFGIGDLVERIQSISAEAANALCREYEALYDFPESASKEGAIRESIKEQAKIELALRAFLEEGGYTAFTTNFEDLHGMKQLPGLAVQRLMAEGYGFGGEGDWKTAALTRIMKMIANNQKTSFMEDYTYHLEPGNEMILGSHMLEVCPTVASTKPRIVVHPLSMGNKADPARLVFDGVEGKGVNVSLIDMGNRFRLIVNEVEAVKSSKETPHLPVAKVLWKPQPSLREATEAWIYAGGAHHTVFSGQVSIEQLCDWADMVKVECVVIDRTTQVRQLRKELQWSEAAWK